MGTDIRLQVALLTNPKWIRLGRMLGEAAQLALIRLWLWTAEHRSDGALKGLDDGDVELFAGWSGEAGKLTSTLLELALLERTPGGAGGATLRVRDWGVHNPFRASAYHRSETARANATKRWAKRRGADKPENQGSRAKRNATRIADPMPGSEKSNAPPPTPTPTPVGGGRGRSASPAVRIGDAAGLPTGSECEGCGLESSGPSGVRLRVVAGRSLCSACEPVEASPPCPGCGASFPAVEAFARRLAAANPSARGVEHCPECGGWSVVRPGSARGGA